MTATAALPFLSDRSTAVRSRLSTDAQFLRVTGHSRPEGHIRSSGKRAFNVRWYKGMKERAFQPRSVTGKNPSRRKSQGIVNPCTTTEKTTTPKTAIRI